jgi:hypothetical protein
MGVDMERPGTSFAHLRRDHEETPEGSRLDHYREWVRLVDARLGSVPADRVEDHARWLEARSFSIHFHAWDRGEFVDMLDQARSAYDLPLDVVDVVPNVHEFIAILRKGLG